MMKCPQCQSAQVRKNGHFRGRQRYRCKDCKRQFIEPLSSLFVPPDAIETPETALPRATSEAVRGEKAAVPPQSASQNHVPAIATEFSQTLSLPELLQSDAFSKFIHSFQQSPLLTSAPAKEGEEIAILLLDAENIKIEIDTERFLGSVCIYPLQIKIAFANWKSSTLGKQDAELYDRGYQLIHVPGGKNSADGKMIAMGASLFYRDKKVKEAFVCSRDRIFNHLCNELLNQGLTVYQVQQTEKKLTIDNLNTGETTHYSLAIRAEIPSFEGFISLLQEVLNEEQTVRTDNLAKLSILSRLLEERCTLTIFQNQSRDVDARKNEYLKREFTNSDPKTTKLSSNSTCDTKDQDTLDIYSREGLEKAFIEIIRSMRNVAPYSGVMIDELSKAFNKLYKQSALSIIKELKLGGSLHKFLKSYSSLSVEKWENHYWVDLAIPGAEDREVNNDLESPIASQYDIKNITSQQSLEYALKKTIELLKSKLREDTLFLEQLASEFSKLYGKSINSIIKELGLGKNLSQFLQSSSSFKLAKSGNQYKVVLREDS